jgi:hypothetical protein
MSQLLRFPGSVKRDPAIKLWMHEHSGVKLRPERDVDATALIELIETAYIDMKRRLKAD